MGCLAQYLALGIPVHLWTMHRGEETSLSSNTTYISPLKATQPTEYFHWEYIHPTELHYNQPSWGESQAREADLLCYPPPPFLGPSLPLSFKNMCEWFGYINTQQEASKSHHPSVLGKLAFKLRYFKEVNHPRASQLSLCSLFLPGRSQGALTWALGSLQRGTHSFCLSYCSS